MISNKFQKKKNLNFKSDLKILKFEKSNFKNFEIRKSKFQNFEI